MTTSSVPNIRPWREGDADGVDALLAPDTSAIWRSQFHRLHGPEREQPFRQTFIAEHNGIVGVATIAASPVHTSGSSCAIAVHPQLRRQGVATALVRTIRNHAPARFPLRTKVEPGDTAALGFLRAVGGRVYQRANGEEVDLGPLALHWAEQQPTPPGVRLESLREQPSAVLVHAFARLYTWTHATWNPVGNRDALRTALRGELAEVDRDLSVAAVDSRGTVLALALAFPAERGELDVVAETTQDGQSGGEVILAAMLARLCMAARHDGWRSLVFDGHPTDTHLAPVLASMPVARSSPLLLMHIPE